MFKRLFVIALFSFTGILGAQATWIDSARRLTGESERVRQSAIRSLRQTPNLEARIREALDSDARFLALDTIVALGLTSLVPDLIRVSERDPSGYSYHTLNALVKGAGQAELVALYLKRLENPGLSAVAKVALLDSVARSSSRLPGRVSDRLLRDPSPEVRESMLGYLRNSVLRKSRMEDFPRLIRALEDPADLIRLRALSILTEIPRSTMKTESRELRMALASCRKDPSAAARGLCRKLSAEVTL